MNSSLENLEIGDILLHRTELEIAIVVLENKEINNNVVKIIYKNGLLNEKDLHLFSVVIIGKNYQWERRMSRSALRLLYEKVEM
jgi:hypothetical protein